MRITKVEFKNKIDKVILPQIEKVRKNAKNDYEVGEYTFRYNMIATVVELDTGALELIVNYENIGEKIEYLLGAYNDDMQLIRNTKISIIDAMIL